MKAKKLQFEEAVDWYYDNPKDEYATQQGSHNTLTQFLNKPFYCWNTKLRGIHNCCFNHMVGMPVKKGIEHPFYDYEQEIFDAVENHQHIWCKKARGIGFTTFMIRYLFWKCVCDDSLAGQSIFITTGTEAGFAKELKDKLEELIQQNNPNIKLESKYNELWINKTRFKAFPTRNVKDMRGYTDVAFIYVDEADFYDVSQQEEIGAVMRSYEEKSDCKIIMVSTANRPDGLFHAIENDEAFKGFFFKLLLLVEKGVDKIFDRKQLAKIEKDNPDYDREYRGLYIGRLGNVWSPTVIQLCQERGTQFKQIPMNTFAFHPVGVDYGYSDSKTVICVGEWLPEYKTLRIIRMDDFGDRPPTPEQVANRMWDIYVEYGPNTHFFVDGSNASSVNQAKVKFNENPNWRKQDDFKKRDRIHPIHFGVNQEHKSLLQTMYDFSTKGMLAIPKEFDKLITSMRTAQMVDWDLNKDDTVNNDHLDAARLMCRGIKLA